MKEVNMRRFNNSFKNNAHCLEGLVRYTFNMGKIRHRKLVDSTDFKTCSLNILVVYYDHPFEDTFDAMLHNINLFLSRRMHSLKIRLEIIGTFIRKYEQ